MNMMTIEGSPCAKWHDVDLGFTHSPQLSKDIVCPDFCCILKSNRLRLKSPAPYYPESEFLCSRHMTAFADTFKEVSGSALSRKWGHIWSGGVAPCLIFHPFSESDDLCNEVPAKEIGSLSQRKKQEIWQEFQIRNLPPQRKFRPPKRLAEPFIAMQSFLTLVWQSCASVPLISLFHIN